MHFTYLANFRFNEEIQTINNSNALNATQSSMQKLCISITIDAQHETNILNI